MIHHEAKYATDEIQATVVTVEMKRQAITFAVAYCPPEVQFEENRLPALPKKARRKINGRR
jgi:hypothetical protein